MKRLFALLVLPFALSACGQQENAPTTPVVVKTKAPVQTAEQKGQRVALKISGDVGDQYVSVFAPEGWLYKGRDKEDLATAIFTKTYTPGCSREFSVKATGTIDPDGPRFNLVQRAAKPYEKLVLAQTRDKENAILQKVEMIGHQFEGKYKTAAGTSDIVLDLYSATNVNNLGCPQNERGQTGTTLNIFANSAQVDKYDGKAGPTGESGEQIGDEVAPN